MRGNPKFGTSRSVFRLCDICIWQMTSKRSYVISSHKENVCCKLHGIWVKIPWDITPRSVMDSRTNIHGVLLDAANNTYTSLYTSARCKQPRWESFLPKVGSLLSRVSNTILLEPIRFWRMRHCRVVTTNNIVVGDWVASDFKARG